jgi:hypothetical protein
MPTRRLPKTLATRSFNIYQLSFNTQYVSGNAHHQALTVR